MKRALSIILVALILFSLAACGKKQTNINTGIEIVDPYTIEGSGEAGTIAVSSEKTAYNPLTGISNMAQDRVGMRPIAVSVNNIRVSWPQYGISQADYIIEIETEGGITRLMCLFSDTREVHTIGSLRSLRDQFMEAMYPLNPIIVHFGTSIYAERVIEEKFWFTIDAMNVSPAQWTDTERLKTYATEHTKFTGGAAIEEGIKLVQIDPKSESTVSAFNFIGENDSKIVPADGTASAVTYNFSDGYDGDFRYDESTGKYLKWQHGMPHIDAGNEDAQLAFDNVILLFADISLIPNQNVGLTQVAYEKGGEGYYFTQGHYEKIKWEKDEYPDNFRFTRISDGQEISVNVGKTHLGIIDVDNTKSLKITD